MLRGLFVGIDLYAPPINRLSCARRDAEALEALFADTVSGQTILLTDHDATLDNIEAALADLAQADRDDLVIVSFSGHGTTNHDLVPFGADPDQPQATMLSLGDVAARLDDVPAKNLFVILDCCFSGGFGGERAFAPARKRRMSENRDSLIRLGNGRVVITACDAGEPALETSQLGHGLLTAYLLEALQGPPELGSDPQLPIPSLLQYVVRRVTENASAMGLTQTPTTYSSLQGNAHLPRLTPGVRWERLHPESARTPVTSDWRSLEPHGLPSSAVQQWANAMPCGPNDLQLAAFNDHGLLAGRNLLVVAPTSSGKTMIGEVAAIAAAAKRGRAVFLLPLKALVNDKYNALRSMYGDELAVVRATGDHADQIDDLLGGHFDIALLTYEKFTGLVLVKPHIMRGVDVVVIDEAQMITDTNRGANLEFALTLLRRGYGSASPVQLIALSAATGDTAGLERWLNAGLLRSDQRPVPLIESVIDSAGNRRSLQPNGDETVERSYVARQSGTGSQASKPWIIGLVRRLVQEGKKVIIFRNQKAITVATASYLVEALGLDASTEALAALPTTDASAATDALHDVLQSGVAFHNADLEPVERAIVEVEFRDPDSDLQVVVATTTLAMGINTPAEAVVIEGLVHPPNVPYSVAEYKNMVGRAGRLGHADTGESYLMATGSLRSDRAWDHYVNGDLEPVMSRLLDSGTDPRAVMLRALVAIGGSASLDEVVELVESSFAAWQISTGHGGPAGWKTSSLGQHADSLRDYGFLEQNANGTVTLTALGRFAGESGVEMTSFVRLLGVMDQVQQVGVADLVALAQLTVELDEQWIATNRRSYQEQARWRKFLTDAGVQQAVIGCLHVDGGELPVRAKRAAATLYFINGVPMRDAETDLLRHVPETSASGAIRAIASRTRDVLGAVATVADLRADIDCAELADELSVRLEFGVPAEMIAVAGAYGSGLTRGDYLALHRADLRDAAAIEATPQDRMAELLSPRALQRIREVST